MRPPRPRGAWGDEGVRLWGRSLSGAGPNPGAAGARGRAGAVSVGCGPSTTRGREGRPAGWGSLPRGEPGKLEGWDRWRSEGQVAGSGLALLLLLLLLRMSERAFPSAGEGW